MSIYNHFFSDKMGYAFSFSSGFFEGNENFQQTWKRIIKSGLPDKLIFPVPDYSWYEIVALICQLTYAHKKPNLVLGSLFQLSGVMLPLQLLANDSIALHYNRLMLNEAVIAAHCLTEPQVGTDVFNMRTTARRKGKGWVIRGGKTYICNASFADMGLVYARYSSSSSMDESRLMCFIVDLKREGIVVSEPLAKIGLSDINMASIEFNDVLVDEDRLLGGEHHGNTLMQCSTSFERIIIPIGFIGIMMKLYDQCVDLVKGRPDADIPLANLYIKIDSCLAMLYKHLSNVNLSKWHRSAITVGCLLKVFLSEAYISSIKIAQEIYQLMGCNTSDLDSLYADSLSSWIYSGTNDVLKQMLVKLS